MARPSSKDTYLHGDGALRVDGEMDLGDGEMFWDWDLASNQIRWRIVSEQGDPVSGPPIRIDTGAGWRALIHPDDFDTVHRGLREALLGRHSHWSACFQLRSDDTYVRLDSRAVIVRADDARAIRLVGSATVRKEGRVPVSSSASDYALAALSAIRSAVIVADARRARSPVLFANTAFEELTGCPVDSLIGRSAAELVINANVRGDLSEIYRQLRAGEPAEFQLERRRGELGVRTIQVVVNPVCLASPGDVTHFVGSLTDVTEQQVQQAALAHRETHDPLTNLPNRRTAFDLAEHAISVARRFGHELHAYVIDVDDFSLVNTSFGQQQGDRVLRELSQRLSALLREGEQLARVGGDQFAILSQDDSGRRRVAELTQELRAVGQHPFEVGGERTVFLTMSIGISRFPEHAGNAESLMQAAEAATYRAKWAGKNTSKLFSPDFAPADASRFSLAARLREAFANSELEMHYQPQGDLRENRVWGCEALMRWQDPQYGWVSPAVFIPAAENNGLMPVLGEWALHQVCAQIREWQDKGIDCGPVAVNISPFQFRQQDLVGTINAALREYRLRPECLEIELTETTVMERGGDTRAQVDALSRLGVCLTIDDFGTGYSSFDYLRRLPIRKIKIDRSFISDIVASTSDRSITEAILSVGRALGMSAVAEGVETLEQLRLLLGMGCLAIQGWVLAASMPGEQVPAFLKRGLVYDPTALVVPASARITGAGVGAK